MRDVPRILACSMLSVIFTFLAPSARAEEDKSVDIATDKALRYLKRMQNPDGSWPSKIYNRNSGVASLAVMAFMAKGYTPRDGEYTTVIRKGIDYVLRTYDPKTGMIAAKDSLSQGPMYSHGISTLMLAQAVGMTSGEREKRVREVLEAAVKLILRAQKLRRIVPAEQGGWRYHPFSRDSDISVTGWQLMSLRAAKNAGADVPADAIEQAAGYIKRCIGRSGGFRYTTSKVNVSRGRAGIGILCLEICAKHHTPTALRAADYLLRNPPKWPDTYFYYGVYHSAQGMFQIGGKYWDEYRPHMEKLLLGLQNYDGSWPMPKNYEQHAGPVYHTAMAALALSVKYHYLPIYQR